MNVDTGVDIDQDFNEDLSLIKPKNVIIYENSININDMFIIYLKKNKFIGQIIQIQETEKTIELSDENKNTIELNLNIDGYILLNTENYNIIDIEKVIKFTEKQEKEEFDDLIVEQLKQDIYPEINFDTIDRNINKYIYTNYEKREILLSNIIDSLNLHDHNNLKIELSENIDVLLSLKEKSDNSYLLKYKGIPNWLRPITTNYNKIYSDEVSETTINPPNIIVNQENELLKINNSINNSNDYFDELKNIFNNEYNPTQIYEESTKKLPGYKQNYSGEFFMNFQDFSIDSRRSSNSINYNDKEGINKIVIENQLINFDKFILFPLKFYNFNVNINIFNTEINLKQKIIYDKLKKNINNNSKLFENIMKNNTIYCNLDDSEKIYDNTKIIIYRTYEQLNKDLFFKKLREKLPEIKDILQDTDIPIYNYNDINQILLQYDITIDNLKIDDKIYINKLIEKSIKYYKKQEESIKYKKLKRLNQSPSNNVNDIIRLKKFIYKLTNINQKNYYLQKFIEKYTKTKTNSNWLHNIYTDEPLICKHYQISTKISTDKRAYKSLIDNWAGDTKDGIVYCKHCNEYLTLQDFSLLEGFEENKPMQTKEVLKTNKLDDMLELSESQLNDVKLIKLLSVNIGINLENTDIMTILNLYKNVDNLILADERYNKINVVDVSYPSLVKSKSKLTKVKYDSLKLKIRKYIYDSNKVIFLYICILILIQINIPGYKNTIEGYELLNLNQTNFLIKLSEKKDTIINSKGIIFILNKIKSLSISIKNQNIWKNCSIFINEYNNPDVIKPIQQIKNVINYIFTPYFPQILKQLTNYYTNNISNDINYLKNYWNTYKPLPDDTLIYSINKKINSEEIVSKNKEYYLIKNLIEYTLENITNLQDINNNIPLYKIFNIKILDILNNKSFERLYNYIIYLHGVHDNSGYINNLINRFIDTIDTNNQKDVLNIFEKNGWNKTTKSFKTKSINFKKLKNIILKIINYYKKTNLIEIQINDNDIFNNIKLNYINTQPKRIYDSESEDIFKNLNKNILDKLKEKYCYDKTGKIILNDINVFHRISIEFNINKIISNCSRLIKKETIQQIIYKIHTQNILEPIYFYKNISNIQNYEKRIVDFININKKLKLDKNMLELYEICINIINKTGEDGRDLPEIYKQITINTNSKLDIIIEFIETYPDMIETLKNINETKNIFGNNWSNIRHLINPPKQGDEEYNSVNPSKGLNYDEFTYFNNYISRLISIISNSRKNDVNIPTWWNLSEYKKEILKLFLSENYLVNHNSVFLPSKNKNTYEKYFQKNIYFTELLKYIEKYNKNTEILKGVENSLFTHDRSLRFQRYCFVNVLYKIYEFIEKISDINDSLHQKLEVYYSSLNNGLSISDCVEIITNFLIELIIDILQEYNDPTWIMNINNIRLSEKLSIQKEREKLELTNKLDKMDANQRYVYIQKQNIGAVNWFKNAEEEHEKYINSEEYKQSTLKERNEYLQNIYKKGDVETQVLQAEGINTNTIQPAIQEQEQQEEGYYDEYDIDNQEEGEEYISMNVEDNDIMGID